MTLFSQKSICTLAAAICAALCLTLMFIPGLIFWLFQMAHDVGGVLISRRAAMLFAGLSILAWLARDLAPSEGTRAIFISFAVAMGGLALLGVYEYIQGNVGIGIALAIAAEAFFVGAFLRLARS
ncbi:hypothetical protein [Planktotalea sp.]|uniref:hypothetical protein n=1 Tax=Planktotalea sp. TaxID=2029877 RepID=UPI00329985D2